MTTIRIAVIYPDLLGTYGDGGNGEILLRRATWRGISAELVLAPSSDPLPKADLYCLGGGEDGPQVLAAQRLSADGTLSKAVADGAVVLSVCAGFQILGHTFPDARGQLCDGLGLLDVETRKGSGPRAVGEVIAEVAGPDVGGLGLEPLSGFENHGGVTTLGADVTALGTVRSGVGNGGGDRSEGALLGRVVGTYLHGPVLARNPGLADVLLGWATGIEDLEPLDDSRAESLRAERFGAVSRATSRAGGARRR